MVDILLLLVILGPMPVQTETETTLSKTLDRLFADSTYDRRVRPLADEGQPTNVSIRLKINTINDIDEVRMQFSINLYLRVSWIDKRLRHNLTASLILNQISGHLTWLPDLFFANEENNREKTASSSNQYERIYPTGEVLMSKSVSATFSCFMDIRLYPVDNQTCFIQIESYGHTTDELNLHWDLSKPILINDNLFVTEFSITHKSATRCDTILETGTFPCLKANFHFLRISGVYLMNAYLPAVLVVIMSWVAFWLHTTAIAARISIGLLTVLTMTTQTTSIISDLPKVPYIKAIEIWMCSCLVFVFVAFLETALAFVVENVGLKRQVEQRRITLTALSKHDLSRKSSDVSQTISQISNMNSRSSSPGLMLPDRSQETTVKNGTNLRKDSFLEKLNMCRYPRGKTVDRISRVCFPFIFAIFNIIYWIICYTR